MYLELADKTMETWVRNVLGETRVTEAREKASHILTTVLETAKEGVQAGKTVGLVARNAMVAREGKSLGCQVIGSAQSIDAVKLLAWLFGDAPVWQTSQTVTVLSEPGAGGSFVAWNLAAALRQKGMDAVLVAPPASPVHHWGQSSSWIFTSAPAEAAVRVLDGSGVSGTSIEQAAQRALLQTDAVIWVTDSDPARQTPIEGVIWMVNRWPEEEEIPDGAAMVFPDFGHTAFVAMREGQAVSERISELAEALSGGLLSLWGMEATSSPVDEAMKSTQEEDTQVQEETDFTWDEAEPVLPKDGFDWEG